MAKADTSSNEPKVTRIKATDGKAKAKPARKRTASTTGEPKQPKNRALSLIGKPFRPIIRYFVGAWVELRQVRWPNRRMTWGMTGALLGFTAFFVAFILIVDVAFEYLFKLILR